MDVKVNSNLIKTERESRGWTQEHLANVAGLSLRTIQRIEKTGTASFESVTALASVLAVSIAELRVSASVAPRKPVLHLSLELPLRLSLALLSGLLCALHFHWRFYAGFGIGFQWFDFGIAGALFALAVLCPYLSAGPGLILRAFALIAASAVSYYCAIMLTLNAESWLQLKFGAGSFVLGSCVGIGVVFAAATILIPLRLGPASWFSALAASVPGGMAMYAAFEFSDTLAGNLISFSIWHVLACLALRYSRDSHDAHSGWLADFAQHHGRFSLVPGWLTLGSPILARLRPAPQMPA